MTGFNGGNSEELPTPRPSGNGEGDPPLFREMPSADCPEIDARTNEVYARMEQYVNVFEELSNQMTEEGFNVVVMIATSDPLTNRSMSGHLFSGPSMTIRGMIENLRDAARSEFS